MSKESYRIIQMPYAFGSTVITKFIDKTANYVIMATINEEQEALLDSNIPFTLKIAKNLSYNINLNNVYCYGEIDFDNDEDLDVIDNFNWLRNSQYGEVVYSGYNYKKNTCKTPIRYPRYYQTFSSANVAQQAYGRLGCPKRIVIFRDKRKK